MLHKAHPGAVRMKKLARGYMWWPGMDGQIEQCVKECMVCQNSRKAPQVAPLHPWTWPDKPWSRIHIDYAGPFQDKMFLLVIDAYTKWLCPHNKHPSSTLSSYLRLMYGVRSWSSISMGHPSFTSLLTLASNGSLSVQALICELVSGDVSKCSIK